MKGINALNLSCVCAVLGTFPDISAEWLMRGEGQMLSSANLSKDTERIGKLVDTINLLQDTINEKDKTIQLISEQLQQLKNKRNN